MLSREISLGLWVLFQSSAEDWRGMRRKRAKFKGPTVSYIADIHEKILIRIAVDFAKSCHNVINTERNKFNPFVSFKASL